MTNRVKCAGCGEEIHVEDYGGTFRDKHYHDYIHCMIAMGDAQMDSRAEEKEDMIRRLNAGDQKGNSSI